MKKKCLIYPLSDEMLPIIDALENKEDYEEIFAVIPKSWYKTKNQKSYLSGIYVEDYLKRTKLEENYEIAVEKCDVVIIANSCQAKIMYSDVLEKIELAIKKKRHIVCCTELLMEDLKYLQAMSTKEKVNFEYLYNSVKIDKVEKKPRIMTIEACVIIVGNLLSGLNSTYSLVALEEELKKKGYRTLVISDNPNTSLLGYEYMEKSYWQNLRDEEEKIYTFNHYIHKLEEQYCPDVILLQHSWGLMKYSDTITDYFGIYAYLLSQAVHADYCILNLPFGLGEETFVNNISECFEKRFNFGVDAICVHNQVVSSDSEEEMKVIYDYIQNEEIASYITYMNQNNIICVNAKEKESYYQMLEMLEG